MKALGSEDRTAAPLHNYGQSSYKVDGRIDKNLSVYNKYQKTPMASVDSVTEIVV